ncbi:MAG: hypothetical protein ACXIVQ_11655 [Acidimicrobiales bacterium]
MTDPETQRVVEEVADAASVEDLEPVAPERIDLPPLSPFNAFATFSDSEVARDVIVELERAGIDGSRVSALTLEPKSDVTPGEHSTMEATADEDSEAVAEVGSDAGKGAAIGAVAGALGGTAIAIAIPGVGTALGAGILAVTAGGAVAGTGVGGFAGAVSNTPASRGWEQALLDVDHGVVVVGVHTDDRSVADNAAEILGDAATSTVRLIDGDGTQL